jgi:hypothetical protein
VKILLCTYLAIFGLNWSISLSWGADASDYNYDWGLKYKDQPRSLIPWEKINSEEWLDFDSWKRKIAARDNNPEGESQWRDRTLIESMGRILECLGECVLLRGKGTNLLQHQSPLEEGDEILTKEHSFAWIFLSDGTLVRLSPNSSISLREINISETKIFLHARINYGNIYWQNRQPLPYIENDLRETDVLFLPLDLYAANLWEQSPLLHEERLIDSLESSNINLKQNARVNSLIKKNNYLVGNKTVENFLVTPTASVHGTNLKIEFVVVLGGETYLKNRSNEQLGLVGEELNSTTTTFDYRGYDNYDLFEVLTGHWYGVSNDGRTISTDEEMGAKLQFGEFVTSKINSILVAREMWVEKYGACFYSKMDEVALAEKCSRRLWQDSEIELRLKFMREHTRRIETSNLLMVNKIKQQEFDRGNILANSIYNPDYYLEAYEAYLRKGEVPESVWLEEELNSTKRFFWKVMTSNKRNHKIEK